VKTPYAFAGIVNTKESRDTYVMGSESAILWVNPFGNLEEKIKKCAKGLVSKRGFVDV
jgi:hypothetical protein